MCETALLDVRFRAGFHECDLPAVTSDVQSSVGVADRRGADRFVFPEDRPRSEFGAEEVRPGEPVEVSIEEHRAADPGGHVLVEVDFLRADAFPVGCQRDQSAAFAGASDEDFVFVNHRRQHARALILRRGVLPEELAGLGIHADEGLTHVLHVLLLPGRFDDHDAGVIGDIPTRNFRFPDHAAIGFLERGERRLAPSGGANKGVAVDQHRLGVSPRPDFTVEFLREIFVPNDFALDVEAVEFSVGGKAIEFVAIDRRGGPGAGILWGAGVLRAAVNADHADLRGPRFLARFLLEGDGELFALAGGLDVNDPLHNGRGRVPGAEVGDLPRQLRTVLRPFLEQACITGDPGAFGAAPLRPIGGIGRQ